MSLPITLTHVYSFFTVSLPTAIDKSGLSFAKITKRTGFAIFFFDFLFVNNTSSQIWNMGNDGGTKALSRKYSRWSTKKEVAHVESEEAIQGKWSTCALSGEVLQEPVN